MQSPEPDPGAVPEPPALTGADIDRVDDERRRDPAWLAAQLASPSARAVVLGDAGVRGEVSAVARVPLAELDLAGLPEPVLLGLDGAGPLYAVDEQPAREGERARIVGAGGMRGEAPPQAEGRLGLRAIAQSLPQAEGGLVAYAAGLLNWHRTHRFCGTCGGVAQSAEGGMVRHCTVCGTHLHPRTDPVVIMLVTDGAERVLLGRQRQWPAGRYSALAGFVSHGESLEEAVAREVMEEVGVAVGRPVYSASQPWPFPYSLMLGFLVPWAGGEISRGDDELEHAAWFNRAEVEAALGEDGWDDGAGRAGLLLPPRSAIARRLIEQWAAQRSH